MIAWGLAVIAAVALVAAARSTLSEYGVAGASMEHTLRCAAGPRCSSLSQDELLVDRASYWFNSPAHGNIIVFRLGSEVLVKRIIGVPGDVIAERRGRWYRNGWEISEPYVWNRDSGSLQTLTVPSGSYFVLGDDRSYSRDSRAFGFVKRGWIIGRAVAVIRPIRRLRIL